MTYLEKIKEHFKDDKFASETTGIRIDSAFPADKEDEAAAGAQGVVCSLEVLPKHKNAAENIMGGVLFTLADYCFAIASNGLCKTLTVTVSSSIQFCGVCRGDKLIGRAECIKDGRKTSFYCINISDNLGNKIASVSMTGYKIDS